MDLLICREIVKTKNHQYVCNNVAYMIEISEGKSSWVQINIWLGYIPH